LSACSEVGVRAVLEGEALPLRMGEEQERGSTPLAETLIPLHEPHLPLELVESALQILSGVTDAVFRPWISDRINLIWLENESQRLGMTRFEEGPNELARRRRLRIDPGKVTIGLHPLFMNSFMRLA